MDNWSRFWSKVRKRPGNQCWPWLGARAKKGQGVVWLRGIMTYAHRAAWILTHGEIPPRNRVVHTCDTAMSLRCCRPDHLMCVGTSKPRRVMGTMAPATLIARRGARTQAQAAKLLRVHISTYNRWENGRSPISASRQAHILEAFRTL